MKYKFDDMVVNSTTKKKPEESDRLHYIGLEHIDSGTFEISRWGADAVPIGDKLIMKKGDVLFGKRRAYQRKVAIAPFDGIFSAHGMVLRPKEDVICKEYFPFFISSNQFMDTAVRISVGGLSPTVNWKDLQKQEFELPRIEQQRVLADKLWAAYNLKEAYKKMIAATDEMVKSQFIEMFENYPRSTKLGDVFILMRNGANIKQGHISGGIPVTRIETISEGLVDRDKLGYAGILDDKYKLFYLEDNDILVSHINSIKHIGKCALYKKAQTETIIHGMNLLCLRHNTGMLNPVYALYLLRSEDMRKSIVDIAKPAVNQASFTVKDLAGILIKLPPMNEQNKFSTIAQQADKSKSELRQAIDKIDKVIKSLQQ